MCQADCAECFYPGVQKSGQLQTRREVFFLALSYRSERVNQSEQEKQDAATNNTHYGKAHRSITRTKWGPGENGAERKKEANKPGTHIDEAKGKINA